MSGAERTERAHSDCVHALRGRRVGSGIVVWGVTGRLPTAEPRTRPAFPFPRGLRTMCVRLPPRGTSMSKILRGLAAGWGAKKLGGGCFTTVLVFILLWWLLGNCGGAFA